MMEEQVTAGEPVSFGTFRGYRKNTHYGYDVFFSEHDSLATRQAMYHFQFSYQFQPGMDGRYSVQRIETIVKGEETSTSQHEERKVFSRLYRTDLERKLRMMFQDTYQFHKTIPELEFRKYLQPFEVKER